MILAQWNFDGSSFGPTTADSDFQVSNVYNETSDANGDNSNLALLDSYGLGYASDPVLTINPPAGATSAALAVSNNSYFVISITPNSGVTYSIDDLTFKVAKGGGATPRGYEIRSSLDNYATSIGQADVTAQRTTFEDVTIDLSGNTDFDNLTGPVSFRIFVYTPGDTLSLDFDEITINGTKGATGTIVESAFRFRLDDGNEANANFIADKDANIIRERNTPTRLRVQLNSTLDRPAEKFQLEHRNMSQGNPTWKKI